MINSVNRTGVGKGNALVVDDNAQMRFLAENILSDAGYEVFVSNDGEEALRMAETTNPDVIVMDILMPGIDGIEVCLKLKSPERNFRGKIILVSSKNSADEIVRGLEFGADDYITKPYHAKELVARVNTQYHIKKIEDDRVKMLDAQKKDLELGALIQGEYLTNTNEVIKILKEAGFCADIFNQAPESISGDLFCAKPINEMSVGLFLADVCGHGIPAALISMRILSVIDELRSPIRHPSEFLEMVNNDIQPLMPMGRFIAASYIILRGDRFFISNAAQPYPILVHNDRVEELRIKNPPLGMGFNIELQDISGKLELGDKLIMYSDGIIEGINESGEIYGESRLKKVVIEHLDSTKEGLRDLIVRDARSHSATNRFDDDVTLIIIEREG